MPNHVRLVGITIHLIAARVEEITSLRPIRHLRLRGTSGVGCATLKSKFDLTAEQLFGASEQVVSYLRAMNLLITAYERKTGTIIRDYEAYLRYLEYGGSKLIDGKPANGSSTKHWFDSWWMSPE